MIYLHLNAKFHSRIDWFALITFPKLPLPKTVKKWKSSTEYFLNRGIVVAGAVIVPDRWNCAYVYDVSMGWEVNKFSHNLTNDNQISRHAYCVYTHIHLMWAFKVIETYFAMELVYRSKTKMFLGLFRCSKAFQLTCELCGLIWACLVKST